VILVTRLDLPLFLQLFILISFSLRRSPFRRAGFEGVGFAFLFFSLGDERPIFFVRILTSSPESAFGRFFSRDPAPFLPFPRLHTKRTGSPRHRARLKLKLWLFPCEGALVIFFSQVNRFSKGIPLASSFLLLRCGPLIENSMPRPEGGRCVFFGTG